MRGFCSTQAIAISAVLSLVLLSFYALSCDLVAMHRDDAHAALARAEAKYAALKEFVSRAGYPLGQGLECRSSEASRGKASVVREICALTNPAPPEILTNPVIDGRLLKREFPRFDYDVFFAKTIACGERRDGQITSTEFGFALGEGSLRSSFSCRLQAADLLSPASLFRGNLAVGRSLTLPAEAKQPVKLGALGYIDVNGRVSCASDCLIVAGGDLHIQRLEAPCPVKITAVSATGRILSDFAAANVFLKAVGRRGVKASPRPAARHELQPPLLQGEVVLLGKPGALEPAH